MQTNTNTPEGYPARAALQRSHGRFHAGLSASVLSDTAHRAPSFLSLNLMDCETEDLHPCLRPQYPLEDELIVPNIQYRIFGENWGIARRLQTPCICISVSSLRRYLLAWPLSANLPAGKESIFSLLVLLVTNQVCSTLMGT